MNRTICSLVGTLVTCLAAGAIAAEPLNDEQVGELQALGSKGLGIRWVGRVYGGSERGVAAVTDGVTTLTVRKEFRTLIVHNTRATRGRDQIGFRGSADVFKRTGLKALAAVGVERGEIGRTRVLQQYSQTAYMGAGGGKIRRGPAQKGRRTLLVTRQVDKVPVISSRMTLNLDRDGRTAFMELVWPQITPEVREEVRGLQAALASGYKPPPLEGARVESSDVVILHSPAVSFDTDMVAAVRVIYRPQDARVGKKPVRYLDAQGRDVPLPRQLDLPAEEKVQRSAGGSPEGSEAK